MTQFETTSPYDRIRRGTGSELTRTDPGTIATPGLAITPPVSRGAAILEQTLAVLAASGRAAGTAADFLRGQRYDNEREAAKAEAERAKLDVKARNFDIGLAKGAIDQDLIKDVESVSKGAFDADERSIPEILNPIIDARTKGMSEAYKQTYNAEYRGKMESVLLSRREALRDKAGQDNGILLTRNAYTAPLEQMQSLISDYKGVTRSSDLKAQDAIMGGALRYAAATGDEERVKKLSEMMPDTFALEKAEASVTLENVKARKERDAFEKTSDKILTQLELGASPEAVKEDVRKALEGGTISPEAAAGLNSRADSVIRERETTLMKQRVKATLDDATSKYTAFADALLANGRLSSLQDAEVELPDGRTVTIKAKDTQKSVMDREFRRIDSGSKSQDEAVAKKVEWATYQGVWPDEWSAEMNIGAVKAAYDTLVPPPGKPIAAQVGDDVVKGFEAYRKMRAMNPRLAKKVVNDDDANALYEMADSAMRLPQYADPRTALLTAGRVLSSPVRGDKMPEKAINDRAAQIGQTRWDFKQDPINTGYVADTLRQYTRIYYSLTQGDTNAALDLAEASFKARHFLFRGQWLPNDGLKGESADAVVNSAAPEVFRNYVLNRPSGEDVKESDLTFHSDGQGGFIIANRNTGLEVEGHDIPGLGWFTFHDLENIGVEDIQRKAREESGSARTKAMQKDVLPGGAKTLLDKPFRPRYRLAPVAAPEVATKAKPPYSDPRKEAEFQAWYRPIAQANGLDLNPDDPEHHYDYRRAWEAGAMPGADRHWPSAFKLADHPNRYVNGEDTITGRRVGDKK